MATIQDVAKHAKVGVGTVSRVLSGKGYVKEETRQKIEASIEALNYTPNAMARNLFFHRSGIVAVIVPEVGHPFFSQFVNAAEKALCEQGFQTMICNTYYKKNYERCYLDMLKQQRVDGIIFAAHTALDISQYENIGRPIVALDRNLGEKIPCVSVDHETGGRMAAEEMIYSGCRNVVQFRGPKKGEVSTPSDRRHDVFEDIMKKHGIACQTYSLKWHSTDVSYYQKTADELLEANPGIDGVFATDTTIMAVMQSALSRGIRIPEQLKLVAYDGTFEARLVFPRITMIKQPVEQLAGEAVQLMSHLIHEEPVRNHKVILQAELCPGDTTVRR